MIKAAFPACIKNNYRQTYVLRLSDNPPKMVKSYKEKAVAAIKPKSGTKKAISLTKAVKSIKMTNKSKSTKPVKSAGKKIVKPGKSTGKQSITPKKPEVKAMANKPKKAANPQRVRLEKELKAQISKIDNEGLIFLLKQVQTILHNMQVDKINKEIDKFESTGQKGKSGKAVKEVIRTAAEVKPQADGKSFIIILNNARKIFSLAEMRKLVSICEFAKSEGDASSRLYSWFSQNRGDVIGDVGIGNPRNPVLAELYKAVKSKYKTKK
jgi:hypothetical protein